MNPRISRQMRNLITLRSNLAPTLALVQSTPLSDSLPVRRNKDRKKRVSTSIRNGTALVFDGPMIIKRWKGSLF